MQELGRLLVIAGVAIVVIGLVLWWGGGRLPLGRLPGDIIVEKPNLRLYFPLTTSLLISLLLTLLAWLFRR